MADPLPKRRHGWLRWAGLQEPDAPAVDSDAWTPVVSGCNVNDPETGHSDEAVRVIATLEAAGIETRQRAYVLQNDISMGRVGLYLMGPGPAPADRIRVAVVVHQRDLARAQQLVTELGPPQNTDATVTPRVGLEPIPGSEELNG